MGRHASTTAGQSFLDRLPGRSPLPWIAAAVVGVLVLAGGIVWATVGPDEACADTTTVQVAVAPELAEVARDVLREPQDLGSGACALSEVSAQRPLQTVGDLVALDADALPDVWVPDSTLWTARVDDVALDPSGSMALSPVVLATSRASVEALGWAEQPPAWSAALTGERPLAVPDLATSAEGLTALGAVRESLGGGEEADTTVVQAVLATARGPALSPEEALASGSEGGADAPLVPVSEQEVVTANLEVEDPALVAVYPAEGTPALDYPVVRVGSPSEEVRPAVDAVIRALTSERAREMVQDIGFRTADGGAFPTAGEDTGTREEAPELLDLDPRDVEELLGRVASLAAPSRLLAVFDVSTSMQAPVGDGTRATLARDAAKSALALFPARSAIGLWFFALELEAGQDWSQVTPIRTLEADAGGGTQREVLVQQIEELPQRLTPGGTGLYDTTLAAVRAAREEYDPEAVSSVVIVTDGENEDTEGIDLAQLVQTLEAETDPERPVKVIGVALGPEADLAALEQIGAATGGAAYSAVEEEDLQQVLFDALRQRG